MPEPFKTIFNPELIVSMGDVFARVFPAFDRQGFVKEACDGLDALEMMARSEQISLALDTRLPKSFIDKADILVAALHPETTLELKEMAVDASGIAGWAMEPLTRIVARHGLATPKPALAALKEMTMRFSSEFAVRPFFRGHQALTLETAMEWAEDDNAHVRRLASEGARPLLPWGIKLQSFVDDPAPLIPLLTKLRDDPSEYVRRSVANNLNDISKNQPDLVAQIAADWSQDAGADRTRLLKHACRGLIKAGHPNALEVFGYGPASLSGIQLEIPDRVRLGEDMPIVFRARSERSQRLLIDYVLHFRRKTGALSPKVFKWTEMSSEAAGMVELAKTHKYRRVTTRKDYAGMQRLEVQINGAVVASKEFELLI